MNVPVTLLAALITTVHVVAVIGVQAALKAPKLEPVPGAAFSVTTVPAGYDAEHTGLHEMGPVSLAIVPLPVAVTVSVKAANRTVTARAWLISTLQLLPTTDAHPVKPTSP